MGILITRRRTSVVAMMLLLSSCTSLPRSETRITDIDKDAAIKVTTTDGKVGIDYVC